MAKTRKVRGDIKIGNLEKKLGLKAGSIRNPDGSDARSDKQLKTLRKEFEEAKKPKIKANPAVKASIQKKAASAVKSFRAKKK